MIPFIATPWVGLACGLASLIADARSADVHVRMVPGQAEPDTVELQGVSAGAFRPERWEAGQLHFVPDVRSPLLHPRQAGTFRNIYAPSAVRVEGGWRLFYGGWDGIATGNDGIYSVFTADFLDFGGRRTELESGDFVHVCNVSALRLPSGAYAMMCTCYPDGRGLNKPGMFTSHDGRAWNGRSAPYAVRVQDTIAMTGWEPFEDADINGMNVLLHEDGVYRLYFGSFRQAGKTYRATSQDGRRFQFEGSCLESPHLVNDVKKFSVDGATWYLMGLHANGDRLWYALSRAGMKFEHERELARNTGAADRYIVALGWVTQADRVLGFLYGAGAAPELNRNRIFARWLQKRVVFTDAGGGRHERVGALGPDRLILPLKGGAEVAGHIEVFDDDGRTPIGSPVPVNLKSGCVYRLSLTGEGR